MVRYGESIPGARESILDNSSSAPAAKRVQGLLSVILTPFNNGNAGHDNAPLCVILTPVNNRNDSRNDALRCKSVGMCRCAQLWWPEDHPLLVP